MPMPVLQLVNLRSMVNGVQVNDASVGGPIVQRDSKVARATHMDLTSPMGAMNSMMYNMGVGGAMNLQNLAFGAGTTDHF